MPLVVNALRDRDVSSTFSFCFVFVLKTQVTDDFFQPQVWRASELPQVCLLQSFSHYFHICFTQVIAFVAPINVLPVNENSATNSDDIFAWIYCKTKLQLLIFRRSLKIWVVVVEVLMTKTTVRYGSLESCSWQRHCRKEWTVVDEHSNFLIEGGQRTGTGDCRRVANDREHKMALPLTSEHILLK